MKTIRTEALIASIQEADRVAVGNAVLAEVATNAFAPLFERDFEGPFDDDDLRGLRQLIGASVHKSDPLKQLSETRRRASEILSMVVGVLAAIDKVEREYVEEANA